MKKDKTKERMTGKNNPAYQHGGRLSPFSEKFVKYQNISEEEKASAKNELIDKSKETKLSNHSNNTTLEYYLKKGLTLDEAKLALSERQTTFSLEKCIGTHGEGRGHEVWLERQNRWQLTLENKTIEEKKEISSKKGNRLEITNEDVQGTFYIIKIADSQREFIKIGITSYDLNKRYGKSSVDRYATVLYLNDTTLLKAFIYEQLIKEKFLHAQINKDEQIYHFGWSESFYIETKDDIISYYKWLLDDDNFNSSLVENEGMIMRRVKFIER